MKKLIFTLALFGSHALYASTLSIDSGITVLSLNGKEVKEASSYQLQDGQNQIVAEFSKRVSHQGKSKYISTPPYIMTFTQTNSDAKSLRLLHNRYSNISDAVDSNSAIFKIENQSTIEQEILPSKSSFMPYSDIPLLVSEYNAEKGLPFGIVEQQQKVNVESKQALNNLKYWYQQASTEELNEFEAWIKTKK
ncbi:DUF2057 family protein [Vibrio sp.]|uniref:DUF2057 family protein n=1 Tax=Vibrio sp. TaxID=678 RepID=UPI003AA8D2FF